MSKKTKILDTKMLYYFMEGVTISIFNESFITFIQPVVMPSPPLKSLFILMEPLWCLFEFFE